MGDEKLLDSTLAAGYLSLSLTVDYKPQALLLTGLHAGLYTCIYTQRWASSLCYCLCALTEIGSPMLIRVNNDVTLGLVNPKVTSLSTLIIIGLPTSVRALSHNRERRFPPFSVYWYSDQRQGPLNNNACATGYVQLAEGQPAMKSALTLHNL